MYLISSISYKYSLNEWYLQHTTCLLLELQTQTWFGDLSFIVASKRLWNSLLATLRHSDRELVEFKQLLTTHLFRVAEMAAHQ